MAALAIYTTIVVELSVVEPGNGDAGEGDRLEKMRNA
jgi:hypothetical protein